MNRPVALILLVVAAFAAPGAVALAERARTVMGLPPLAPGIPYMPNGVTSFYITVSGLALLVAAPMAWSRMAQADYRLSKNFGTFLAIMVCWKVIDVTLLADGGLDTSGMAANLVLSIGTFGYAFLAALVFWAIAVRPHEKFAQEPSAEGTSR